jgi:hypothetical protein
MKRHPNHLEGYCDGMAQKPPQHRPNDQPYQEGYLMGQDDRSRLDGKE